jgi:voltage-gated potassium channel
MCIIAYMEKAGIREKLRTVIFGTHTQSGKVFDVILLWLIVTSILCVIIESIPEARAAYGWLFYRIDWVFTLLFTVEYALRIYSTRDRSKYIFSSWGVIDFLSIVPSYITLLVSGYQFILVIRVLRLLRIFRILRLFRFISEGQLLTQALRASIYKIIVFMTFIFILVILLGTLMYIVEHGNPGFRSIPSSIYWAIVTITTVGFGDIVPVTYLGKLISSVIMLAGYAIIAVPTGIVTAEIANSKHNKLPLVCTKCKHVNSFESKFCSNCGDSLLEEKVSDQ